VIRDECLKIANLGHASRYTYSELVTGEISQLAYASPEIARLQCSKELQAEKDRMNTMEYEGTVQLPIVDESRMHGEVNDLSLDPTQGGLRIAADPAQDMWSVGAILYYLCTGETLFLTDNEEGIDADQLQMLIDWPDFAKQKRVNKVKSPAARHLVSLLLSKDPLLRPSASYCLTYHPYLLQQQQDSDEGSVRFPGEGSSKYDVFISYRKQSKRYRSLCTDNDHCAILTELFANRGISVISTSDCSGTAVRNSSSSLSHSMTHSSAAIIILSHYALFKEIRSMDSDPNTGTTYGTTAAGGRETALSIFEKMSANSEFDEFLYELRLAVELRSIGLLEKGLFIVAVGEQLPIESSDQLSVVVDDRGRSSGCSPVDLSAVDRFTHWKNVSYSTYFEEHYGEMIGYYGGSHSRSAMPHVTVRSVEEALDSFLHDSGYGKSTVQDLTIMELFRYLVRLPTYHVVGPQESAFQHTVDSLADVLSGASVILSNRASTGKVVASADVVIADVALSRPSTAAFDMILGSTIRNNPITMMMPMMHTSKSRASTPALMEGLLQSEHFDNRTRSPLTGLRVQAYIPSGDSPKKPSSQQRSLHDLSTAAGIRITKTPASSLDDVLGSRRGSPDIMNSSPGATFGESFRIPIQTWDAAADDDPINYTAAGVNFTSSLPMEVPFVDIELNNGNSYHKLPYFTEIVGEDRVRSAAALSFMSSKLEVSENHIANLQDELMLLRKKMSSSDAELADLRNKMAKGSIRYPPSSSSKKRPK
jgi:serine/threonine protein kinase